MNKRNSARLRGCTMFTKLGAPLALAIFFAASAGASEAAERKVDFNIPATALDYALLDFAEQADVQIAMRAHDLDGLRARSVKGGLTPQRALRSLIDGAPVVAQWTSPSMVSVRAVPRLQNASFRGEARTGLASAAPVSEGAGNVAGDDIVVTARRREERLADVPIAVTALSEDKLKAAQVVTPKELAAFVPSLNVNTGNAREGNRFTLRGQGATLASGEAVVTYLAEAPVPYLAAGAAGMYFDLANVQVLNGPQGTLFGRNTTGGAVLFTPRRPTSENAGFVEFGYGNYNNREMSGAMNVALVPDKLMVRVAGTWRQRDGYTRNVHDGEMVDNMNYYGIRASVLAQPVDWIENYFLLQLNKSSTRGTGVHIFDVNPDFSIFKAERIAALAKQQTLGKGQVDNNSDHAFLSKTTAVVNTTVVTLSDNLRMKNIFSYFGNRSKNVFDTDGTAVDITTRYDFPGYGNVSSNGLANEKYITEELQFSGEMADRRVTWVAGGFYLDYKPKGYSAEDYSVFAVRRMQTASESGTSKALYAQATIDLGLISPSIDDLKLTAGYRYTWDRKEATNAVWNKATMVCLNKVGASFPNCQYDYAGKFSKGTYTLGLDYKIGPDFMIYAATRHGYKSGGFNSNADPSGPLASFIPFGPETITDYEVGLKAGWNAGPARLHTTLAAFTADYKGIQRTQTVLTSVNPPVTTNLTVNAATGKISGIELQQVVRAGGWTLDGSFSYLDAHYKDFVLPGGTDRSGIQLPYSPRWKLSGSIAYTTPLGGESGDLTMRASYNWSSRFRFNDPDQPGNYMGGYGLFNVDASAKKVGGTPLDVDVFMTNVLNKRYKQQSFSYWNVFGTVTGFYVEPRMFGVRGRYNF